MNIMKRIVCLLSSSFRHRSVRNNKPAQAKEVVDFLQIDRGRHRVTVLAIEIPLTPTEFRMLETFAASPGRVLGHDRLLDQVWEDRIRGRDEVKLCVPTRVGTDPDARSAPLGGAPRCSGGRAATRRGA
jgi:DNA-binding response OmpR family regulator